MSGDMAVTRRQLLRGLGTGIIGAAVRPSMASAGNRSIEDASWSPAESGPPKKLISLSRNENAYGPSRQAIAATRQAAAILGQRKPDEARQQLREAVAALHGVPADRVALSSGSSEILRSVVGDQRRSHGRIVAASPVSEWFSMHCQRSKAEIVTVPLTGEYEHDLDAMVARIGPGPALVYICNPHNPTGTPTNPDDLEAFVRSLPATARVLIDEAYHHYVTPSAGYSSWLDRSLADPRVIVTRSFSKIHGLAGLRVGYAVALPDVARRLRLSELEESVSVVSAGAALAALDDTEHVRTSLARNTDDRQEFFNDANARMLRVIDSQSNFVMLNCDRPAAPIVEHLRKHNVVVPSPFAGSERYIRVSMGMPEDMRVFWRVWDLMPGGGHGHGKSL
jgi:histidinol-phosphate aminotransferase